MQRRRHVSHLTRRGFVAATAGCAVWPRTVLAQTAGPRIVSLDYGIATTLLALGVTPAGVAAAADWDVWVVEPKLPESVVDIGDDLEVNLELLAAMRPDIILSTPYLDPLKPALERIAPVLTLAIHDADGEPLERAEAATRILGERLGLAAKAERFLAEAGETFDAIAQRIAALPAPDVALVNFMDARHARVYGRQSLYQNVLDRIGLENAWTGPTNYWGFQTIGIEELGRLQMEKTHLIAFEPVPPDILPTLAHSPLWTSLPFVREGRVSTLPGVLMFGMVPSALRFANLLVDHLERLAA